MNLTLQLREEIRVKRLERIKTLTKSRDELAQIIITAVERKFPGDRPIDQPRWARFLLAAARAKAETGYKSDKRIETLLRDQVTDLKHRFESVRGDL